MTSQQLAQITQQTGMNQTEVIAVAIDRMYREVKMYDIKTANFVMEVSIENGQELVNALDFESACAICREMGVKVIQVNGRTVHSAVRAVDNMIIDRSNPVDIATLFEK